MVVYCVFCEILKRSAVADLCTTRTYGTPDDILLLHVRVHMHVSMLFEYGVRSFWRLSWFELDSCGRMSSESDRRGSEQNRSEHIRFETINCDDVGISMYAACCTHSCLVAVVGYCFVCQTPAGQNILPTESAEYSQMDIQC